MKSIVPVIYECQVKGHARYFPPAQINVSENDTSSLSHPVPSWYVPLQTGQILGACIDKGASDCVTGQKQDRALCSEAGETMFPARSGLLLKFGKGSTDSSAFIVVRITTPDGSFLQVDVDVGRAEVTFILGLDIMTANGILIDLTKDIISHASGK